jgi:predicted transcriptional regulator YdeE
MVAWEVPASAYAVPPANDVPGLAPGLDFYYGTWLPQSTEWEGGEPFNLEVYPESYSQDLIIYLRFPIKRKGTSGA